MTCQPKATHPYMAKKGILEVGLDDSQYLNEQFGSYFPDCIPPAIPRKVSEWFTLEMHNTSLSQSTWNAVCQCNQLLHMCIENYIKILCANNFIMIHGGTEVKNFSVGVYTTLWQSLWELEYCILNFTICIITGPLKHTHSTQFSTLNMAKNIFWIFIVDLYCFKKSNNNTGVIKLLALKFLWKWRRLYIISELETDDSSTLWQEVDGLRTDSLSS